MADLNVTGCSDEELIAALRGQEEKADIQGDTSMPYGKKDEIQEYILGKYKPLVRKRANALYLIGGDTDDLIQEFVWSGRCIRQSRLPEE